MKSSSSPIIAHQFLVGAIASGSCATITLFLSFCILFRITLTITAQRLIHFISCNSRKTVHPKFNLRLHETDSPTLNRGIMRNIAGALTGSRQKIHPGSALPEARGGGTPIEKVSG